MTDANFLAKECRAETEDEQHAAEYEAIYDEVDAECEHEYNSHGMAEFGFKYEPDSAFIHREVERRMKAAKK